MTGAEHLRAIASDMERQARVLSLEASQCKEYAVKIALETIATEQTECATALRLNADDLL